MSVAFISGAAGLIGFEAARLFSSRGMTIVGIDNDMRAYFFGRGASNAGNRKRLEREVKDYTHHAEDIRDRDAMERIFSRYGSGIAVIIHTAAQPSHDWAAREPMTDFEINATGTLNLLELARRHCPDAAFIFTSTNKVYGDTPNRLPYRELETRWEVAEDNPCYAHGIDETMSIDRSLHSLFGVSKLAADVMVQEFGRCHGMKTVCFRAGCLTGPAHQGAELHGFLAYLARCAVAGTPYTVFGYKGKQVRDNIHALDLVEAFWQFFEKPRQGEVYNIGGGRQANCSVLEAIALVEREAGRPFSWSYREPNRTGDHIWWISDIRKFQSHYPGWRLHHGIGEIVAELVEAQRLVAAGPPGATT
jgi:CDP-paratose 2-epimerase